MWMDEISVSELFIYLTISGQSLRNIENHTNDCGRTIKNDSVFHIPLTLEHGMHDSPGAW